MDGANPVRAAVWLDLFVTKRTGSNPIGEIDLTPVSDATKALQAASLLAQLQTSRSVSPANALPGERLWRSD